MRNPPRKPCQCGDAKNQHFMYKRAGSFPVERVYTRCRLCSCQRYEEREAS